jgi:hypothetical protein
LVELLERAFGEFVGELSDEAQILLEDVEISILVNVDNAMLFDEKEQRSMQDKLKTTNNIDGDDNNDNEQTNKQTNKQTNE